jgi:hypothetical protein
MDASTWLTKLRGKFHIYLAQKVYVTSTFQFLLFLAAADLVVVPVAFLFFASAAFLALEVVVSGTGLWSNWLEEMN